MKAVKERLRIDTIFVLVIFCIFALSVLTVLMLSADIYRSMTDISRDRQDERTILSYIGTRVRAADEVGMIYVGDFDGINALFFDEVIGDTLFRTAIYHYNGWAKELFSNPDVSLPPSAGTQLMIIDDLYFREMAPGIIVATSAGVKLMISPRTTQEVP